MLGRLFGGGDQVELPACSSGAVHGFLEGVVKKVRSQEGTKGGKVIDKDVFAALALSSHVLLRSKINFHAVVFGATLGEWFLVQGADPKVSGIAVSKSRTEKGGAGWSLMGGNKDDDQNGEYINEVFSAVMTTLSSKVHGSDEIDYKITLGGAHLEIFLKMGMMAEPYHIRKALTLLRDGYIGAKKQKSLQGLLYSDALSDYEKAQALQNDQDVTARERARAQLLRNLPRLYLLAMQYSGDLGDAETVAEDLVTMRLRSVRALPADRGADDYIVQKSEKQDVTAAAAEADGGEKNDGLQEELEGLLSPEEIEMQKELERARVASVEREKAMRKAVHQAYSSAKLTHACVLMALTAYPKAMAALQDILDSPQPPLGMRMMDVAFVFGRCWELKTEQAVSMDHPLDGYISAYEKHAEATRLAEKAKRDREEKERKAWLEALRHEQEEQNENADSLDGSQSLGRSGVDGGGSLHEDSMSMGSIGPENSVDSLTHERRDAVPTVAAPVLDLAHVIAERKKAKEAAFQRRKMIRKMRRAGLEMPEEVDPEELKRQEKKRVQRGLVKKWLAQCDIWVVMGDTCLYLSYPSLGADFYRQGILRDNAGYSNSSLWFRWAKASHRCSREYDVKLALNQAQHFQPENRQIQRFRKHFDFVGHGKSSKAGGNVEPRLAFEKKVQMATHHSSDGRGESMKFATRVREALAAMCADFVALPNLQTYRYYASLRLTNFVRKVALRRKQERERRERERLEALWSENPAVTPQIVWAPPTHLYYPEPLTEGVHLNAYAPVPVRQKANELDFGDSGSDSEEEGGSRYRAGLTSRGTTRTSTRSAAAEADTSAGEGESGYDDEEDGEVPRIRAIEGTWTYEPGPDAPALDAGEHVIRVTFRPHDIERYTEAISAVRVTVHQNAKFPKLHWPDPEPVRVGEELGAAHLDAKVILLDREEEEEDEEGFGDSSDGGSYFEEEEEEEEEEEDDDEGGEGDRDGEEEDAVFVSPAELQRQHEERRRQEFEASLLDEGALRARGMGELAYAPPLGTHLPIGTHSVRVCYRPFDPHNYRGAEASVRFVVLPLRSSVQWEDPPAIHYPKRLGSRELNAACAERGGTFVYEPSSRDNPLCVGTHSLTCHFWPYDHEHYGVEQRTVQIRVNKCTPTIRWPTPPLMYQGDCLSYQEHLNAVVVFQKRADVPALTGVFRYTHDPYSYLRPAHHQLKCLFMPDDMDNYCIAEASVTQTVRCRPFLKWRDVPVLRIGNQVEQSHLCARCSDCKGAFVYDPPLGSVADAGGERTFTVTFEPLDQTVYDVATLSIVVDVLPKLKPELAWADPVVQFGMRLSLENALCCSCDQPGYFTYAGEGVPFALTLTPAQRASPTPEQALQMAQQSPAALDSGKYVVQANFYPQDAQNYSQQSLAATLTVDRLVVALSYGPFEDITYGDAVHAETHLAARITGIALQFLPPVPVPAASSSSGSDPAVADSAFGCFSYNLAPGTLLKAGTHDVTVTYTPTDTTNFSTASVTVPLKVRRHAPVVQWPVMKAIHYSALLSEKQLCATVQPNCRDLVEEIQGALSYSWNAGHRFGKVGRQPISCTFVPEDGFNYSTTHVEREISVRRFAPKISWATPAEIFEGQKLTEKELNASCDFPSLTLEDGKLEYDPPLGKKLEAGEHHLLCKFVPNPAVKDNFDLRQAYAEVTIYIAPTRGGVKSRGGR